MLNSNLGSNSFRHGYMSNGFVKLNLHDSISSLSCLVVDENSKYVKQPHRLGHIRNKN